VSTGPLFYLIESQADTRALAAKKWELAQITEEGLGVKKTLRISSQGLIFLLEILLCSSLWMAQIWRLNRTARG
jgi:hypothetical protein